MMHMTFYWSKEVTLLVDSWHTSTWTSYIFTLLACFIVSSFYQFMEERRVKLKLLAAADSSKPRPVADSGDVEPIETPFLRAKIGSGGMGRKLSWGQVCGGVLFGVNSAIGYVLMLGVMSFNGGVFVSVVCGLGFGYMVFRSGGQDVTVEIVDNACACA